MQTRRLRPAFLPPIFGVDFFLVGYRIFVRYRSPGGRRYRGLQILGSETDKRSMVLGGRLMTHYGYRRATTRVERADGRLEVATSSGLEMAIDEAREQLWSGSVFPDAKLARRYSGPMPFTFGATRGGRAIVRVEGVRAGWQPRLVAGDMMRAPFLDDRLPAPPSPAAAFLVEDVDYAWKRGIHERVA